MQEYLKLLDTVLHTGTDLEDRTHVGTRNIFGYQMRFNLAKGFPLLTTKKIHLKSVIHELLWFLKGDTNTQYLKDHGVSIWNAWADDQGDLGPIYGKQWRDWNGIDQLRNVVDILRNDPHSRRAIVSAWNVSDLDKMALHPCHCLFQFFVIDHKVHCHLYQRSADVFLGVPFNLASYALLTHIIAAETLYDVGDFVWTGGVVHLYKNHFDQAKLQLTRTPQEKPALRIKRKPVNFDYREDDFEFINYNPDAPIKAPIAI